MLASFTETQAVRKERIDCNLSSLGYIFRKDDGQASIGLYWSLLLSMIDNDQFLWWEPQSVWSHWAASSISPIPESDQRSLQIVIGFGGFKVNTIDENKT